jgi:hypothetical protein
VKQPKSRDLLGVRFLGLRAIGDPEQALRQFPAVDQSQDHRRQLRHHLCRRDSMRREEIRDPRRLIVGRREDACAHGSEFGFADQQADHQVVKGLKHLDPHQRAKTRDAVF